MVIGGTSKADFNYDFSLKALEIVGLSLNLG